MITIILNNTMKKTLSIIFLLLFFLTGIFAQGNKLSEGNEFYKANEYQKAIEAYNKILQEDIVSAEIYFNLANCYFKEKEIAPAILNYERAKKLNPDDEDILYNLELAQKLTTDKIEVLPEFFANSWFVNLRSNFTEKQWSVLSIILFTICLIFSSIFLYSKQYTLKKISFIFAVLAFIISSLLLVMANSAKKQTMETEYAIIFTPSVTLKSSPDKSGNNLFVLHEGSKVKIIDKIGDWSKIRISDGNQGWLLSEDIVSI